MKPNAFSLFATNSLWRICAGCGSVHFCRKELFVSEPIRILCEACNAVFLQYKNEGQISTRPFRVHSLYTWPLKGGVLPGKIIHQLKGSVQADHFVDFAELHASRDFATNASTTSFSKTRLVIPAPPREEGLQDHATTLAIEIKKKLGCEFGSHFLRRQSAQQQKRKSQTKRWQSLNTMIEPTPHWEPQKIYHNTKIIFVDDLITTGVTATAAYLALGRPKDFEVWTIFWRPSVLNFN